MSIPPSKAALPRRIDVRKLVQREQQLIGIVPGNSLPRLASAVESIDGDVRAELAFGRDLERHLTVTGQLHAAVELLCQRCLQPVIEEVNADVAWGVVWTEEQGKALPKSLDPVVQDGDELNLYDVIEEEILLNLPMVAYHAEDCVERDQFHAGEETGEQTEQRENPFKVLEQLKGRSNKP